MARHRSFSSEFKRQLAKEFLDGRAGLHELAHRHSLSRNLIRLWIRKYEAGEFTDELVSRPANNFPILLGLFAAFALKN